MRLDGFYKICVELQGFGWDTRQDLFFGLKILSENMDHPNLSNSLKLNETDGLKQKFDRVSSKAEKFVESQNRDINIEDDLSETVFKQMKTFYFIIFVQIMAIILLAGYQLFSFRKVILNIFFY